MTLFPRTAHHWLMPLWGESPWGESAPIAQGILSGGPPRELASFAQGVISLVGGARCNDADRIRCDSVAGRAVALVFCAWGAAETVAGFSVVVWDSSHKWEFCCLFPALTERIYRCHRDAAEVWRRIGELVGVLPGRITSPAKGNMKWTYTRKIHGR